MGGKTLYAGVKMELLATSRTGSVNQPVDEQAAMSFRSRGGCRD